MASSSEPQLDSFFGPSIREFLLYAASTTEENEPEYDSAPAPETETSRPHYDPFDSALPGPSLLEDNEIDNLVHACASCLGDLETEPLGKRPRIDASTSSRKFGPAKTDEDLATARTGAIPQKTLSDTRYCF